jgi:hypothetical protein
MARGTNLKTAVCETLVGARKNDFVSDWADSILISRTLDEALEIHKMPFFWEVVRISSKKTFDII